ncbi:hypothetical protein BsWGS_07167 [Bradybaena similaris]
MAMTTHSASMDDSGGKYDIFENVTQAVVEKTMAEDMHFVMSAIVGPIICCFGMIGNILSIITWCRPGMCSSTGRYLTGQAVADLAVLLMFLLCDSALYWNAELKYSLSYGIFFSYIGYPLFFLSIVLSIWITVGVTIDRYIMVCWITKSKQLCSLTRANIGLALITVNAFLINLPHFATFTVVYPDSTDHNHNSSTTPAMRTQTFKMTEFGAGSGGQFYEFWIHCIILILIPWVSVLTLNIMIINKISKSNKRMANKKTRESMKKSKESENQITRLLLVVTFSFLFFIGLQCIIQCFAMQKPIWADMQMVSASFAIGKTGIIFNSSLNFVFYCLTGKRFRVELIKMLGFAKGELLLTSSRDYSISGSGSATAKISTTSSTSTGSTTDI